MFKGRVAERLIVIFIFGLMALNFPLLAVWEYPVFLVGIPLFPLALFSIWLLIIGLLAWLMELRD